VLRSLEQRFAEVRENEQKLAAALQQATNEALEVNRWEVEYNRLARTQENSEKLYGVVLGRLKASSLSSQLRVNNIRLLDRATAPVLPVKRGSSSM